MFLFFSISASADDVQNAVQNELFNITAKNDMSETVLSTNRIIKLGESAVEPLNAALSNPKTDLRAKWSAAMALGQIGSEKAIPVLEGCLKEENPWLKDLCKSSIGQIKGEQKRSGKVYLWEIGVEKVRIDVEAGTREVIK